MVGYIVDETDRRILRHLVLDARQPIVKLAQKLGLSESSVRHRINRLVKHHIIRRFSVQLDYNQVGCPIMGIIGVKVGGKPAPEAAEKLQQIDEIVDIYTVTGEFDLLLRVICTEIEELEDVVERIRQYEFIEGTRTFVVLKKIREGNYDYIIKFGSSKK